MTTTETRFLLIDDDLRDRDHLVRILHHAGSLPMPYASWKDWDDACRRQPELPSLIDVAIIDWNLGRENGAEVARRVRAMDPTIATFCLTGEGSRALINSIESRLFDCWLDKQFGRSAWEGFFLQFCELLVTLVRERRARRTRERCVLPVGVGIDAIETQLVSEYRVAAQSCMPVLILGESGTGKEGLAHGLHAASGLPGECYTLNCAALDGDLAQSVLFGHQMNAFTGATAHHAGAILTAAGVRPTAPSKGNTFISWLESSPIAPRDVDDDLSPHGAKRRLWRFGEGFTGTLFLDEVADLPTQTQSLLLRFLDDNGFSPLGYDGRPLAPRVRIIAATSQTRKMLGRAANPIRRDLYFRLAGWVIQLPPLHERPDYGVAVTESVLTRELKKKLSAGARELLREQLAAADGPFRAGNLRALIWCVKRAAYLTGGEQEISVDALREASQRHAAPPFGAGSRSEEPLRHELSELLPAIEQADPVDVVDAVARALHTRTRGRVPLKQWLETPHKVVVIDEFCTVHDLWAVWFVVGMFRAAGKDLTWGKVRELFQASNDQNAFVKQLRDALGKAGVPTSEEAARSIKGLLRELRQSPSPVIDPVRSLLPPV